MHSLGLICIMKGVCSNVKMLQIVSCIPHGFISDHHEPGTNKRSKNKN